jgi:hypothetical protein
MSAKKLRIQRRLYLSLIGRGLLGKFIDEVGKAHIDASIAVDG